jgi:hypothetical protein
VFAPFEEKQKFKEDDDKAEDKPKSIFDRENHFRKPFEEKE